ncbi:MAG: J domain-containing protein [Deltaproteobacteria bacterium]|nr:J domain-containing protein [Deltaproteobacteria bacterium]
MAQDFYVVLGVSRDADLRQIRSAYRQLVKIYHPDAAPQPPERFLEVKQAYETLKDAESRQAHDSMLETGRSRRAHGEPLVVSRSERAPAVARSDRSRLQEEAEGLFTELDEFFAGWIPGLFTRGRTASRQKDLYVELVLSPAEARTGGMIPLSIPVETPCDECGGLGIQQALSCPACRGRGRLVDHHQIEISVPPGVTDGTQARLSLADIGLPKVDLIAYVTVE